MKKTRSLGLRALVELLPRDAIDPVAPVVAVFNIIADCYKTRHFQIRSGQQEFEIVRHAALYLLSRASVLNRFHFWEDLEVPRKLEDLVPESNPQQRWEGIKEVSARLRDETATAEDLVDALDIVDEAFRSMHLLFSNGVVDGFEGVTETERFMCSAMLKPVVDQLNRIWLRLRDKVDIR